MHHENITKTHIGSWEDYIATVWADFFCLHNLSTKAVVVEVGPGFSGKIGRGLAQINFEGTLYVIDQDVQAIDHISLYYKEILPDACIVKVNQSLVTWCSNLPQYTDALLMNHLLDDLILDAALPLGGLPV